MTYLLVLSVIAFLVITIIIINHSENKKLQITKDLSILYKNVINLNNNVNYHKIDKFINLKFYLNSKKSLTNFDLYNNILAKINSDSINYHKLVKHAEENLNKFKKYINDYLELEKYTTKDEFMQFKKVKINYNKFIKNEKFLYNTLKLDKPVVEFFINGYAEYTSPAGRNTYNKTLHLSFTDIKKILNNLDEYNKKLAIEEEIKKEKILNQRMKEKKLRELDSFEKKLMKEKERLEKEKEEFFNATKGHIYSTDYSVDETKLNNSDSLAEQMQNLKKQLDNGLISFEEYEYKRRDLI